MQKLISIIVPVYNVYPFLEECINSILGQTYKNIEIICIDDGSTDGSAQLLDNFSTRDERLKIVHQENRGVSEARNRGLELAKGEYILFVDSDDYIHCDICSVMLEKMESEDVDIVSCSFCMEKAGRIEIRENKKKVPIKNIQPKKFLKYIWERDTYPNVGGYVVTRLFRSELIKVNQIKFRQEYAVGEGALFLAECMLCAKKMIHIEKALYFYRQHVTSVMHAKEYQVKRPDILRSYEEIIDKFNEHHVNRRTIIYVKRFFVYQASRLVEYAHELNMEHECRELKKSVKKYFWCYLITNIKDVNRIARIWKIMRL